MSVDSYAPCPCGSGKKVKFCCAAIIDEMDRINRLASNNQPHMALQALEELNVNHPNNAWIVTSWASLLINDNQTDQAKQILTDCLKTQPNHALAIALYATARFASEEIDQAKPTIQRAFRRCALHYPDMVGNLALGLVAYYQSIGCTMASREHLALALRFVSEDLRREVFQRLLEFDGNSNIPYPLRSVHQLANYEGNAEIEEVATKATRLSHLGCWRIAAKQFEKMAELEPDQPVLWHNVGLCRAWDGDELGASEALHLAAQLYQDFEMAVECETIAQILDLQNTDDTISTIRYQYEIESASKLISDMGDNKRLNRLNLPDQDQMDQAQSIYPVAMFDVLDKPFPTDRESTSLNYADLPEVVATLSIFDAKPEEHQKATIYLTGVQGDSFDESRNYIENCTDGQLNLIPQAHDHDGEECTADHDFTIVAESPVEYTALNWMRFFPDDFPASLRTKLENDHWNQYLTEVWPEQPLAGLGGNIPKQVTGQEDQRVNLTAAVQVLDAFCAQKNYKLDLAELCQKIDFGEQQPLEVSEELPISTCSAMQILRLPIEQLSPKQLQQTLNRAILIRHPDFLFRFLTEVVSRPDSIANMDGNRVFGLLIELCREQNNYKQAYHWLQKGRDWAKTHAGQNAFDSILKFDLSELRMCLDTPDDSELNVFAQKLHEYYSPKIPEFELIVTQLFQHHGLLPPWHTTDSILTGDATAAKDGVWTPDAGSSNTKQPGKLWLSGQS